MVKLNPDPPHAVGGRHTLGSSPETQEPIERAPYPAALALSPAPAADAEPQITIYVPAWHAAVERARAASSDVQPLFAGVLAHLEYGWTHIRPLAHWAEEHGERDADESWHLTEFISVDLVDVFRGLVADAVALVPGYPAWRDVADPGDVDGEADVVHRYLMVAGLAAEHPAIPDSLRTLVRAAAHALAEWSTELVLMVNAIERKVFAPAADSHDE